MPAVEPVKFRPELVLGIGTDGVARRASTERMLALATSCARAVLAEAAINAAAIIVLVIAGVPRGK